MNFTGSYKNFMEICESQVFSSNFIELTRQINIYAAILIIIIGLVGNSSGFLVFLQKKIRSKSTNIYLLCLIISDSLYLVSHFFEDTLKAYIDHYIHKTDFIHDECLTFKTDESITNISNYNLATFINIIDKYDFFCRFINFSRYFLRFVSAYIIVAFTIQRTIAIRKPFLQKSLESKNKLVVILLIVVTFATVSAIWIPLLLHSNTFDSHNNLNECYIREGFSDLYFIFTNTYILVIILIPMLIICVCNSISIIILYKSSKKRNILGESNLEKSKIVTSSAPTRSITWNVFKKKSNNLKSATELLDNSLFKLNHLNNLEIKYKSSIYTSHKLTTHEKKTNLMLLFMSFSYVILDLPYLISWICLFYYGKYYEILNDDLVSLIVYSTYKNYLIGIINLTEVLYLLNYSIHFYIYCISSKTFCDRLKNLFKCEKPRLYIV